jgi:hypothetical protein
MERQLTLDEHVKPGNEIPIKLICEKIRLGFERAKLIL